MADRVPSFFVLVPGPWRDSHDVVDAILSHSPDASVQTRGDSPLTAGAAQVEIVQDDNFAAVFSWGRHGPLPEEIQARAGQFAHSALLEIGGRLDESAAVTAQLGRALRAAGGVAVRMEASGAASEWEPWLDKLDSGVPSQLYSAAVLVVQDDGERCFTCGMHQFDLPDAEVGTPDPAQTLEWLDSLCIYQLAEQPAITSGHTFRPNADSPRQTLERWPDTRHHPDDGRYNPFGFWRCLPEGGSNLQASELVPVLVPSLVATLLATEKKQGRALTQVEVERIVSQSPAIAMQPRDAISLERSRGYADIEPELAWDQWQLVRSTL